MNPFQEIAELKTKIIKLEHELSSLKHQLTLPERYPGEWSEIRKEILAIHQRIGFVEGQIVSAQSQVASFESRFAASSQYQGQPQNQGQFVPTNGQPQFVPLGPPPPFSQWFDAAATFVDDAGRGVQQNNQFRYCHDRDDNGDDYDQQLQQQQRQAQYYRRDDYHQQQQQNHFQPHHHYQHYQHQYHAQQPQQQLQLRQDLDYFKHLQQQQQQQQQGQQHHYPQPQPQPQPQHYQQHHYPQPQPQQQPQHYQQHHYPQPQQSAPGLGSAPIDLFSLEGPMESASAYAQRATPAAMLGQGGVAPANEKLTKRLLAAVSKKISNSPRLGPDVSDQLTSDDGDSNTVSRAMSLPSAVWPYSRT